MFINNSYIIKSVDLIDIVISDADEENNIYKNNKFHSLITSLNKSGYNQQSFQTLKNNKLVILDKLKKLYKDKKYNRNKRNTHNIIGFDHKIKNGRLKSGSQYIENYTRIWQEPTKKEVSTEWILSEQSNNGHKSKYKNQINNENNDTSKIRRSVEIEVKSSKDDAFIKVDGKTVCFQLFWTI